MKNNSVEALDIKNNLKKPIRNILGICGTVSIILGFIRGVHYGGVNNWESLFQPYGRTFLGAILISVLLLIIGRIFGHNLVVIPWKDEMVRKNSLKKIYLAGIFILFCYLLLLFCMVAMRFGGI